MAGIQCIYFLMIEKDGQIVIKIGETADFDARLASHKKACFGFTHDVTVLCVIRGERKDEQRIHRLFAEHLLDGETETFRPHSHIVDYIRWLRDQHFVWVPECPLVKNIESCDVLQATLWMPTEDRRKAAPVVQTLFNDFGPLLLPPRETTPDDFYTGPQILEAARRAMGSIDLDPASHAVANSKVKATRFFTQYDDWLTKQWSGSVWLNPPFSSWSKWAGKVLEEWDSGRIRSMCVLAATRTLTAQYFSGIHTTCNAMCILRGRIPFWGEYATTPDDGHAIFYFGKYSESFRAAFCELGTVYVPARVPSVVSFATDRSETQLVRSTTSTASVMCASATP